MPELCKVCVLPSNFPGVDFENGICQFCRDYQADASSGDIERNVRTRIDLLRNQSPNYDVVVAYSGGKDSTYVLQYLVEDLELRTVAITIDNGFMSQTARLNCDAVTTRLNVDHILIKPASHDYQDIYRSSISHNLHPQSSLNRASSICNSCIKLINNKVLNFAISHEVPIIAGGYIGGQVPSDSGVLTVNSLFSKRGSSHECMHGSGQWQVRHAVIEVADVIRCCPEAIGFMNDELGFVVQAFNGTVVDGHAEVVEDVLLVAAQHPGEVSQRWQA